MSDISEHGLHKAAPIDHERGLSACQHCGEQVTKVPGGQGGTWIHLDGHVVGRNLERDPEVARAIVEIEQQGYTVELKPFCEDSETPGLLGMIGGVTVHDRKAVKVGTHGRTALTVAAILRHELEHVLGAERGSDNPEHGLTCGGSGSVLNLLDGPEGS